MDLHRESRAEPKSGMRQWNTNKEESSVFTVNEFFYKSDYETTKLSQRYLFRNFLSGENKIYFFWKLQISY